jgi:hypothetical protein
MELLIFFSIIIQISLAEDFDSNKPSRCSGTTITSGLSQLVLDPWEDNYPTEPGGNL